jgi:hypothetical protein
MRQWNKVFKLRLYMLAFTLTLKCNCVVTDIAFAIYLESKRVPG